MLSEVVASDVVIVATGATEPIIDKKDVPTNKPITLIDLSVPANISLSVKELENVTLKNVDDLSKVINSTYEQRSKEIPKAEKIIEEMYAEFILWLKNRKYVPAIQAFKSDLERIRDYQIKTLQKDLIEIPENETPLSDKMVQKITNRLADYLISNPEKAEHTIDIFKEIFKLEIADSEY